MEDLTGQTLGDYHVYRRLGRGAMASVYLARQRSLDRQVALKVLNTDLAKDDTYVARFQHEARAAAALVHANIVQIYEVGVAGGRHFIAQEYVAGGNVGELIQRRGRIEPGATLGILRQVTAALGCAAEAGIVHRDIKPENLMIARSGEVKVADFGLARAEQGGSNLTQVGVTMGTPLYMSPEQVEGRPVDARSDLYSLGVTAYHMLAGDPPFGGETSLAVAVQHLNNEPPPLLDRQPGTPVAFSRVVMRLMEKDPAARPAGPAALLGELRGLADEAVGQGWAAEAVGGTLSETMAIDNASVAATAPETAKLSAMMSATTDLRRSSRGARPKRTAAALAGSLVFGLLLAWITRAPSILAATPPGPTEKETVLQQIFHAKLLDTEEAWKIIPRRFPDEDPYYLNRAKEGLIRHYLSHGRYRDARPLCAQMATLDNQPDFQLFGRAGLVVCDVSTGDYRRAERTLNNGDLIDALPRLSRLAPDLEDRLQEAREQLRRLPADS